MPGAPILTVFLQESETEPEVLRTSFPHSCTGEEEFGLYPWRAVGEDGGDGGSGGSGVDASCSYPTSDRVAGTIGHPAGPIFSRLIRKTESRP